MTKIAEVVAESISINCGNLEITDNGLGQGQTLIDGVPFKGVRKIEIVTEVGQPTKVRIEYFPCKQKSG